MQTEDWEQLAANLPCVVYRCRPGEQGAWLYVSPAIERLLGWTAEEWLADPELWQASLYPDDRERVLTAEDGYLAAGAAYTTDSYRLVARDGRVVWVNDDALLRDTPDGPVWEGVLVDIGPVREAQERYERVLAAVAEAIVSFDDDGRVVHANERAAQLFGLCPDELHGREVAGLVSTGGARAVGRRADGSTFPAEISSSRIDTRDGGLTTMVVRDITDRLQADAVLHQLEQEHGARLAAERVAHELQASLLPVALPTVAGLELAARYRPAHEAAAVGGDFWDVIELPDGTIALAIGDVTGSGPAAAALMGQVRNAFRAYAVEGHRPAALIERLGALLRHQPGRLVTMWVGRLDLETLILHFASAGHPPPLLLPPGGPATTLEASPVPPLGVEHDPPAAEAVAAVAPGSLLALYTDGLVEGPDITLTTGVQRLADALTAGGPAAGAADRALEHLGVAHPADDAALLVVGVRGAIGPVLEQVVPAHREQLAPLRRTVGRWLREHGAGRQERYELVLAVGELCANAVDHAYGPGDATFVVRLEAQDGAITVTVRDQGRWRPPRGADRGRGLQLAERMSDDLDVRTGEGGTTVVLSRRLGREAS